jgi:hypothetical protein
LAEFLGEARAKAADHLHDFSSFASRRAFGARDTVEVRFALRCLLSLCPEGQPLEMSWDATAAENAIGRTQSCIADFYGIVRSSG